MNNIDNIMENLAVAATHAARRGDTDIAELIETVMGEIIQQPSFDDLCSAVFQHPDYVIGNMLSRQHIIDNGYDPDKLDPKLADWAAEPVSEVMWECVAEAVQEE